MGAIYPTNPTQGCAFSHLSQNITRLRHGQVPAEKAEIHSSIMYSSIRCDEHMDHLARRKQKLPTATKSETSRGLSSFFHHHFVTPFSLDSQCAWILFSFFPYIVLFKKKDGRML
jgi:hypothetical protein